MYLVRFHREQPAAAQESDVMTGNGRDTATAETKHSRISNACIPCKLGKRKCNHARPCGPCCARGLEADCVDEVKEVSFWKFRDRGIHFYDNLCLGLRCPVRSFVCALTDCACRSTCDALCAENADSDATEHGHVILNPLHFSASLRVFPLCRWHCRCMKCTGNRRLKVFVSRWAMHQAGPDIRMRCGRRKWELDDAGETAARFRHQQGKWCGVAGQETTRVASCTA